jgi:protease IV
MALNADTLLDRIYLKNQARRWRFVALATVVLCSLILLQTFSNLSDKIGAGYIARYTVTGVIVDDKDQHNLLKQMRDNEAIKAVIVSIDSPGGTSVGGQQLYEDLRDLSKEKPVVAVMRTMATSAAYMAAIGTERVFASEGTITGSIGVIIQSAEVSKLVEKLGIEPITVKSGKLKGTPSPFEPYREEDEAMLRAMLNDFFEYFLNLVKERRKLTEEQLAIIRDGRVVGGKQALGLNLIDQLGGEKEAVEWLNKKHSIDKELEIRDVEVVKEEDLLTRVAKSVASSAGISNILVNLDGMVSIWHPAVLKNQQ